MKLRSSSCYFTNVISQKGIVLWVDENRTSIDVAIDGAALLWLVFKNTNCFMSNCLRMRINRFV